MDLLKFLRELVPNGYASLREGTLLARIENGNDNLYLVETGETQKMLVGIVPCVEMEQAPKYGDSIRFTTIARLESAEPGRLGGIVPDITGYGNDAVPFFLSLVH